MLYLGSVAFYTRELLNNTKNKFDSLFHLFEYISCKFDDYEVIGMRLLFKHPRSEYFVLQNVMLEWAHIKMTYSSFVSLPHKVVSLLGQGC